MLQSTLITKRPYTQKLMFESDLIDFDDQLQRVPYLPPSFGISLSGENIVIQSKFVPFYWCHTYTAVDY